MAAALLSDTDVGFGGAAASGTPAGAAAGPKLLSDAEVGISPPKDAASFAGITEYGQPYAAPAPDKPSPQSLAAAVAQSVPQGLTGAVGGVIAGAGRIAQAGTGPSAQRVLASLDLVDAGKVRDAYQGLTDDERQQVAAYRGGGADDKMDQRAGLQQTVQDFATPNAAMRAGASIEAAAPGMFPVAPENEGLLTGVGGMLGGIVPAVAAGAVGGPLGMLASFATIGSQAYDGAYQDAVNHGATHEEADDAAGKAAVAQALTMTLPVSRLLQRVPMPLRDGLTKTLVNMGQNGVEFGSANALGTFANNYVASQTYDPDRLLTQGTGQAALEGTIAGLIVPAIGGAMRGGGADAAQPSPGAIANSIMKQGTVDGAIDAATKAAQTPDATAPAAGAAPTSWGDLFGPRPAEQASPGLGAPAPQSVGSAASPATATAMSPDEFGANRLQGEIERLAAPPAKNDTRIIIPGADPTLAEATGNPVDAMDQAYNRQQPEALVSHTEREDKVADAVAGYYADTAPSAQTLLRMDRGASARAEANLRAAFGDPDADRPPVDRGKLQTDVIDLMQGILDDPRMGERDVIQKTIPALMDRFYNDDGSLKTDPLALYGIREHIGDLLNGAGNPETSGAARQIKRQLLTIQSALDPVIETGAPGFAKFRADYAADRGAIEAGQLLADARLPLLNKDQHITPAKWFNFMKGIVEGRADPMDPASKLSDDQMNRLWDITDQLKRSTFIDAGKPRGSWTSMMQEWGGRFALVAAHAAVLPYAPGLGNIAIQMATAGLRRRSVMKEAQRVLNPDLGQGDIVADPEMVAAQRARAGQPPAPAAPTVAAPVPVAAPIPHAFNDTGNPAPLPAPVAAEIAAAAPPPAAASGAGPGSSTAYTPSNVAVPVRYTVRDASDLIASQLPDGRTNPAFPAELQPRDRTRAASQQQVDQLAATLQPERLGASASTAEGAPIVGRDGVVESGNGRTLAIQQAYAAKSPQADAYRQWVAAQGHDVTGFSNPVLVRERTSDLDMPARARLAADMGGSPVAGMSAPERAAADARAIPNDTLAIYQGGDVTLTKNAPFARAFAEHVVPPGERANFITADGELSQDGAARMRNALTQHAYGSNALVTSLAEHADPDIKAFGGALMDAAGSMAKLRGAIDGRMVNPASDIGPDLVAAANMIKASKLNHVSLADEVKQIDMYSARPEQTEPILQAAFGENFDGRMSRVKFAAFLSAYAEKAQTQSGLLGVDQTAAQMVGEARASHGYGTKTGTAPNTSRSGVGDGAGPNVDRQTVRGPGDAAPGQEDAGSAAAGDARSVATETDEVTPPRAGLINSVADVTPAPKTVQISSAADAPTTRMKAGPVDVGNVTARINPTANDIARMMQSAPDHSLRALRDQAGNFAIWPAYDATHHEMATPLGFGRDAIGSQLHGRVGPKDADYPNAAGRFSFYAVEEDRAPRR